MEQAPSSSSRGKAPHHATSADSPSSGSGEPQANSVASQHTHSDDEDVPEELVVQELTNECYPWPEGVPADELAQLQLSLPPMLEPMWLHFLSFAAALYPYQLEAIQRVVLHFLAAAAGTVSRLPPAISLPTGSGKSRVIGCLGFLVQWIASLCNVQPMATSTGPPRYRALVLVPNLTIKAGIFRALCAHPFSAMPGWDASAVLKLSSYKALLGQGVQQATIVIGNFQQFGKHFERWLARLDDANSRVVQRMFSCLLIDEAHHLVARTYRKLMTVFGATGKPGSTPYVLLSATHMRPDKRAYRRKVVLARSLKWGIDQGKVKSVTINTIFHDQLTTSSTAGGKQQLSRADISQRATTDAKFRQGCMRSKGLMTAMVEATLAKLAQLRAATGTHHCAIMVAGPSYGASVDEYARLLRNIVDSTFWQLDGPGSEPRRPKVLLVTSNSREQHREAKLDEFKEGEWDVVVQVRMLTEGYDNPLVSVVTFCCRVASWLLAEQLLGRAVRRIYIDGYIDGNLSYKKAIGTYRPAERPTEQHHLDADQHAHIICHEAFGMGEVWDRLHLQQLAPEEVDTFINKTGSAASSHHTPPVDLDLTEVEVSGDMGQLQAPLAGKAAGGRRDGKAGLTARKDPGYMNNEEEEALFATLLGELETQTGQGTSAPNVHEAPSAMEIEPVDAITNKQLGPGDPECAAKRRRDRKAQCKKLKAQLKQQRDDYGNCSSRMLALLHDHVLPARRQAGLKMVETITYDELMAANSYAAQLDDFRRHHHELLNLALWVQGVQRRFDCSTLSWQEPGELHASVLQGMLLQLQQNHVLPSTVGTL